MKKLLCLLLLVSNLCVAQAPEIIDAVNEVSNAEHIDSPKLDSLLGVNTDFLLSKFISTGSADTLSAYINAMDVSMFIGLDVYMGVAASDIVDSIKTDAGAYFVKPDTKGIVISIRCKGSMILVLVYSL